MNPKPDDPQAGAPNSTTRKRVPRTRNSKPILGITMGDAAGIGPQIILKALSRNSLYEECHPLVIGNISVLEAARKLIGSHIEIHPVEKVEASGFNLSGINCLNLDNIHPNQFKIGEVNPVCGKAAIDYIQEAVRLAMAGEISAVVTCPISKAAINRAGFLYPGHTELLAQLTNTRSVAMMLVADRLRVILVTIHLSLKKAIQGINQGKIVKTIRLAHRALSAWLRKEQPKLAVAGLNPHAGEGGLFGREEIEIIAPAIAEAKEGGIEVSGPYPPDTVFYQAYHGKFDAVIALYHDQGLIPIKLLAFDRGVNVTLGLPIIRTSPDHGTAFDIAHKNIANPESLIEAIKLACQMAVKR
ncbi:MAG: 4-hydroxythreonine-4-phosphate dehydrogenase PdxA [bacterium]